MLRICGNETWGSARVRFSLVWFSVLLEQYTETWGRQPLSLAVGNNMLLCKPGAAIAWSRRSCLGKRRVCRARRAHQSMQASNQCAAFSCAHGCARAGKACIPCAQTLFVRARRCRYPLRTNGARVGQAPRWRVSHTTKRRGKSFASSEQGACAGEHSKQAQTGDSRTQI
jgi:hypothetical protein